MTMSPDKIQESKKEALAKIEQFLSVDDVEGQFEGRNGNYYSAEKFLVTWYSMHAGMLCEMALDKVDSFYSMYSGYKCVYSARNLVYEKQLKGYPSIEHGLIQAGLQLCSGNEAKKAFFEKYAVKYNLKLKQRS